MLNSLRKLFYTSNGEKKEYKILGLTVVKTYEDSSRKTYKILGIKISKRLKTKSSINAKNIAVIKQSKLFDYEWYISRYNRCRDNNVSPYIDYLRYGFSGVVNPSPIFNTREYLLLNPDVVNAKIDPLLHYELCASKEGRSVSLADEKIKKSGLNRKLIAVNKYTLHDEYREAEERLKQKVKNGEKIKVVFLANMLSMFPGEALMNEMLQDSTFDVRLAVIPDIRFGNDEMYAMLKETYTALKDKYSFTQLAVDIEDGKIVEYNDVIIDADIVCYPSPYDISYSLYNPYYAAQNSILSIHINYGFFRSKYDRYIYQLDNYNNFWRVFLETELNLEEYKEYGKNKGSNAIVTGYSKMDKMVEYLSNRKENSRKTIIIAPHHSVKGGCNDTLALSNFETYSDLFLELPKLYPQIDFIFRPHPVLFKTLKNKSAWGEKRIQAYLENLLSNENVVYSTEGDYWETFAISDGIIQDCGSFLVEYFYTKNPCCYMLKSPSDIEDKFSDLGKHCLEQCYIAYNKSDIINYIDDVIINGNDYKKDTRNVFAQDVVMVNYPNVTKNIMNNLKNIFEVE